MPTVMPSRTSAITSSMVTRLSGTRSNSLSRPDRASAFHIGCSWSQTTKRLLNDSTAGPSLFADGGRCVLLVEDALTSR
jgi:hypothetical protein